MVLLQRRIVQWRGIGHVTEVDSLKKENHRYGGGQFKGGRMVVTEVITLMEGEWSRYRSGHLNGGKMVMLQS